MRYSLLASLISWVFPTKSDRHEFRTFCTNIDIRYRIKAIKKNYTKVIRKLCMKSKQEPLKVLFLVNEVAKWKCQTLYDLMDKTSDFEPLIALNLADIQIKLPIKEKEKILEENKRFFENKKMKVVTAYDIKHNRPSDLRKYSPDIVFYQQPYKIKGKQVPLEVSKYALICYVPYYVPNYGDLEFDCNKELHKSAFRFYVLNNELAKIYENYVEDKAGDYVGAGHTILDNFHLNKNYPKTNDFVIYAPHWSLNHPMAEHNENYATFLQNGKEILEYAKQHKELKWVFKPHPTLRQTLINTGVMTKEEVDNYYHEWESFAKCCYTSDYIELFLDSKAMITDCGSFLIEYFCTGKPLIHLISDDCLVKPIKSSQKIFDTFYKVHNLDEMYKTFDDVLIQNKDYKKDERIKVLDEADLLNNYAAKNIIEDLRETLITER